MKVSLIIGCAFLSLAGATQDIFGQAGTTPMPWEAGVEFQAYPTGNIPGVLIDRPFSELTYGEVRLGYNFVRHRDQGVHDDERGGGPGFSLGVKRYFNTKSGWFLSIRSDLWLNTVDWRDGKGTTFKSEGTTDVIVLQPTAMIGHAFALGDGGWIIRPTLAGGIEINIKTEGEEVGEGVIGLLGVQLSKVLN